MISFSSTGVTMSETLQTNAIVWIHSLPEDQMGPTRRIIEDLEGLAANGGHSLIERPVANRDELLSVLRQCAQDAHGGLRPILHIDAHGTQQEGLLLAPSGERVGWIEITEALRAMNTATQNNLICVFALCFGLHMYAQVRLSKAVPAYMFFAPEKEIKVGFLEDQTLAFYREINSTGNVTSAFEATLGGGMVSFHCQGLFFQALLRYCRMECSGRKQRDRQERLLTAILKRDRMQHPTSAQLKEVRKQLKSLVAPGQHVIDRFAPLFLIGRAPMFTFNDMRQILDRPRRRSAFP
ncbi:hypothetical protein [Erwinia oleae]|uniref:hypothetical protein n=1 Tax=Erwinia oleae TaxID=796334 RepID=UPI0005505236|nr:hypothetical protein [Erwinia oleae]